MGGVQEATCGSHHYYMMWHRRPWNGMARAGEVRERGATIEGLKRGAEPCPAWTVKIAANKRGGERPTRPSY